MTREEAAKYAENMTYRDAINNLMKAKSIPYRKATFIKVNELLKALEQEPNRQIEDYENEIEDLHNRLDIAEYDKERLREEVTKWNLKATIKALEQEPKTGHWIEHPEIETSAPEYLMFYECSECGDKQCFCKSDIHKKHFCNNCGAKMEESEVNENDNITM